MLRTVLSMFAAAMILLQGLGAAWAAPMPMVTPEPAVALSAMDDMQGMPCHQQEQSAGQAADSGCHCQQQCSCHHACGTGAVVLPVQPQAAEKFARVQFDLMHKPSSVAAAYLPDRLRPPIALSS